MVVVVMGIVVLVMGVVVVLVVGGSGGCAGDC